MTRSTVSYLAAMSLAFTAAGPATRAVRADGKNVLHLTAFAVDLGSSPTSPVAAGARSGTLDIAIERWSTPEEVARIQAQLTEKGEEGLLDSVQKLKRVGYIRTPTSVGWPIHFAQQIPGAGGARRIVFATDRPMSFWEVVNRPRSADYAFLMGEIRLGADGKGEGKLVTAGRVQYEPETKTLQIENYATQPVRLSQVRVVD
jgi:hypothetical protein